MLPHFKNRDTEQKQLRIHTLYIWNLNHFHMDHYQMLIFHSFLSFQQNLARGQDKGCYAAQIASEKACEGFTPQKSWRTIVARQTDYLLNVMFPWMSHSGDFLPVMSTDIGWQNLTPEHICILISYKLPVLHSCPFFFFSSFILFSRQETNCISVEKERW